MIKLIFKFNYFFDGAKLQLFSHSRVLYICIIIEYLCNISHHLAVPLISLRYSAGVRWMIF